MTTRTPVILVGVLLVSSLAGCIDGDPGEGGVESGGPAGGAPSGIVAERTLNWSTAEGFGGEFETNLSVPRGADGVFVRYDIAVEGPVGEIRIWIDPPDGPRRLLTLQQGVQGAESTYNTMFAAEPGTWTVEGKANRSAQVDLKISAVAGPASISRVQPEGRSRPVVAIVDTGIDPYHRAFREEGLGTRDLPDRITGPLVSADLHRAETYETAFKADVGLWTSLPFGELIHFNETNVLGISFGNRSFFQTSPALDGDGHGTAVAHAVKKVAPEAIVVVVATGPQAKGVEWAARQPWIDIINLSFGVLPDANNTGASGSLGGVAGATHDAWSRGKLVFSALRNTPGPDYTSPTNGPPWVMGVSGITNGSRETDSGTTPDFVASWTQELAAAGTLNRTMWASGTSFSSPRAAGVAAAALSNLLIRDGHRGDALAETGVPNVEMRDALNRTARLPDAVNPGIGPPARSGPAEHSLAGWGVLEPATVPVTVADLTGEEHASKPADVRATMEAQHQARKAAWS